MLSGKYSRNTSPEEGRRINFDFPPVNREKAYDIIDVMQEMARARNVSVAQIALSWVLHQPAVSTVIIGAKNPQQLEDNLKAVDLSLDAAELQKLDAVSKLSPEYPGWMIERFGGEWDRK